jgi:hypothetical protein
MEQEQKRITTVPFELAQKFRSMPWVNEIKAETFMTYTSKMKDKRPYSVKLRRKYGWSYRLTWVAVT